MFSEARNDLTEVRRTIPAQLSKDGRYRGAKKVKPAAFKNAVGCSMRARGQNPVRNSLKFRKILTDEE